MPEQSINEQTRQMMGMPTSGDPAIIDPTTGRPYTADASMRQQEEITRQAEAKEEFASEQKLQLPKDLEEEIEKQIRPKARPEGLPTVYEKKTAIDKTLEYGYLLRERQPGAKGKTKIVTGLDERNPAHQKTIKAFFDNAVGGDTGFDPSKQAWCAAFVNHILTEMGADLIESKDPYKRLRANEYKTYGKPVDLKNIQEGDIVVFDFDKDGTADHVTFYAGGRITSQGEGQHINVIGGNQGGGVVSIKENAPGYTLDNVAAIRRITYDGDAYEIAQSHKDSDPIFKTFLPEEHKDYAQAQANRLGSYNEGGDVAAQMDLMLPSADDDTRSTKEFLQHPLETVPYFQRPMGSSTDDPQVGQDDAGNPVFKGRFGEYTVRVNPDQRTLRTKVKEAIPVVKEAVGEYLEDPKLPTKDQLSEFAKQAGQSAVESVEDLGDLMFKGKGTLGDVVGLAIGAGTGSIPFSVPEGAIRTFGGGGAKKINSKNFSKAEDLWNADTDNEEIRKQTGWYKDDADRKWRFEIDDSQIKLTGEGEFDWSDPDAIQSSENIMSKALDVDSNGYSSGPVTLYLKDFLDHKKLFKHYPQLKDYEISLNDTDLGTNVVGSFSPTDKKFSLSPQAMQDPEYAKNVLIHELQHGIQEIEGFLPGSNTSETAFLAAKKYGDEAESISKTLESFGFNMDDNYLTQVSNLAEQFNSLPLTEDQKISANKYFTRLIDLDEKLQRAEKNKYLYYVNRSGEVEANLAADRMDLTETQRASFSPIADKSNQITDEIAYRAVDPIIDRRQGQSDILLDDIDFEYGPSSTRPRLDTFKYKGKEGDYEKLYDDRIRDFLKADKSTKGLANLKAGQIVKLGPDNKEYFFLRFTRDDLVKSRLNKNYPHVFHEEMGSEDYPKMASVHLLRVPKPKDERAELLKFIKNPYGTAPNFSFKVKSFSLGDLMFDSNKSTAKPENTGAFRDSIEEQKSFLGLLNRNKPKDFNKGGAVMNEQMEMAFMQQGGLKDDGMRQDPVSGNEVPSGSMASEVRDDIPAQLSEGEYVVPADVVRFFGVKFFEDLRAEAKMGLQSMEANGRIGGEPVPMETGELSDEEFAKLLQQELGGTLTTQSAEPIKAAEGTYVPGQMSSFNPDNYGLGFSLTPGYTPPAAVGTEPVVETEASCAAKGMVLGPDGVCIVAPQVKNDNDNDGPIVPASAAGEGQGLGGAWYKGDEEQMLNDPEAYITNQLGRGEMLDSGLAQAGVMTLPGGIILAAANKFADTEGIARARAALMIAKARGTLSAEKIKSLEDAISKDTQGNFIVDKDGKGLGIGTGINYANSFAKSFGFNTLEEAASEQNKNNFNNMLKLRAKGTRIDFSKTSSKAWTGKSKEERQAAINKANKDARKKLKASQASRKDKGISAADERKARDERMSRIDAAATGKARGGNFGAGSVTGSAVYAGGNRAEGGLMLKKKRKKK